MTRLTCSMIDTKIAFLNFDVSVYFISTPIKGNTGCPKKSDRVLN